MDNACENTKAEETTMLKGALRLPKSERLRHRTLVNRLFEKGEGVYAYPLRLVYSVMSDEEIRGLFKTALPSDIDKVQFMITVPKKKQRRAVNRVLVRRRIREAYRLTRLPLKEALMADGSKYLSMAFIYQSDKIYDYKDLEPKMERLLNKLKDKLFSLSADTQKE